MKATRIVKRLKAQGIWEDYDQPIVNKLLEIEDRLQEVRTSINVDGSHLEFEPKYLDKQQGHINSKLSKIDGTFIYYTLQGFKYNFSKDYEAHCQKHGIEDKKGFLSGLRDAYNYVLSEHELVLEYATLLAFKENDFLEEGGPEYPFLNFETYIKDATDKKKQTLLFHFEAITKDIEDQIKAIEIKADAANLGSAHKFYSSTQNGLLQKQFEPRPFNRLVSSSLQNFPESNALTPDISSPQLKNQNDGDADLFNQLCKEYITDGVKFKTFQNAMNDGDMPPKKMIWSTERGKPADAVRFCYHLGRDFKWWNNYFILANGKPLNKNYKSETDEGDINKILHNYGYDDARKPKEIKAISKFRE